MADEFFRTGGRSYNGLAKAVMTDEEGSLATTSKIHHFYFDKNNTGFINSNVFEKRTNTQDVVTIPHLLDINSNIVGTFEQMITIEHNYNKKIEIDLYASTIDSNNIVKWLYLVDELTIDGTGTNQRLTLTPDTDSDTTSSSNRALGIIELRQAIPMFQFVFKYPDGAPTSGELKVYITRRF